MAQQEYNKSRMSRPSGFHTSYSLRDDSGSQDVIIDSVERSMKKHTENIMRFLEGLSSRLSQLELYCYNVDKSIGEIRSDLARDHGESEAKLKFLEKHVQEVHRSIQIIRDKQELSDTQKELAKLQLAQKDSSFSHESHKTEETSTPTSVTKRSENNASDGHNQQLALALPHQPAPLPAQLAPLPMTQQQQQAATYYLSPAQLPNIPGPSQPTQTLYQMSQPQPQQQQQPQPQYQQQWAPQVPPPQPAVRPSSPQVFSYQQVNPETLPSSLPMQMPYGFGGPGRTNQPQPQPPPQHLKPGFGGQLGDGYVGGGPGLQGNTYMSYEIEGGRVPQHPSHPSQLPQSGYPPKPPQQNCGSSVMVRPPPQVMRNHPYNELIDKLGSMGYRGEHMMNVIQRLEDSGQTVDFNTVLDKLNARPSGGSQRGWSG
ncbi:uncharacterized protein [Rutidosis leptorrhynchoides]|uniref:uncharacterized protein isoform X2 n=1 Tax=Rutidosis leptorrhynchoides TaxID=125765 RepID=UPI003A991F5E